MARLGTQEQLEEIEKCKEDFIYFLKQYLYIKHTTQGRLKWDKPYPFQVRVGRALQNGEDIFVCKSRRVGASTIVCAFALWLTMFFPDKEVIFLSEKESKAKSLLTRTRFMLRNLPPWLRPKTGANTKTELEFRFSVKEEAASSKITSLTTTGRSGAGEDAALVLMDEAAFIPDADDVWAAVAPTAAFGGQRAVVSTPSGTGNFFYRNVSALRRGEDTGFTYIEAHWKRDCGLSDEWYKKATVGLSIQKRLQEFELTFLTTGSPFFDLIKLEQCYKDPRDHPGIADLMTKTQTSYSGVDTSEGRGTEGRDPDYHSINILNEHGVQIRAWHSNTMSLRDFAGHTMELDDGTLVNVEGVPTKVHREYPGVMTIERWGSGDVTVSRHKVPDDEVSIMETFRTTNASKMRLLNTLRQVIMDLGIVVTDPFTYECLTTFEDQTRGVVEKAGAAPGSYDDPVMSLALAVKGWIKYAGYTIDLGNMQTTDGRRMVAMRPENDLPMSKLAEMIPAGQQYSAGPLVNIEVPGEFRRATDEFDLVRSGRQRMLPPGMR